MAKQGVLPAKGCDDFIEAIREQLNLGYGFAPFIGSGVSAASGIMTGRKFNEYLTYVLYKCIGKPRIRKKKSEASEDSPYWEFKDNSPGYWNLKKHGWPDYPTEKDLSECEEFVKDSYKYTCKKAGFDVVFDSGEVSLKSLELGNSSLSRPLCPAILNCSEQLARYDKLLFKDTSFFVNARNLAYERESSVSPREFSHIQNVAIHVMHDWRAILTLLSRLNTISENLLEISEEADSFIIDSFNNHIVWGRKPNMMHYILTYLTSALKIRHIFTTNFDSLIEDAYRQVRLPLQVIPVTKSGGLPDPTTVWSKNSIVKLHGDLHDTRADFSLDEHPNDLEKSRFLTYLWPEGEQDIYFQCSHLLVMGASASDGRTVELFKHVLETKKDFKIFWVAYDDSDEEKVKQVFKEIPGEDRIVLVRDNRLILLLYHMHQRLSLSLPQGGFMGQIDHHIPPILGNRNISDKDQSDQVNDLADSIRDYKYQPDSNKSNEIFESNIVILDGPNNVGGTASELFNVLNKDKNCVWLELENFTKPIIFVAELMKIIVTHVGSVHFENVNIKLTHPKTFDENAFVKLKSEIKEIISYLKVDTTDWVFFVYGRNIPGSCAGWSNEIWDANDMSSLHGILRELGQLGFGLVYMPFSEQRAHRNAYKRDELARLSGIDFAPKEEHEWFNYQASPGNLNSALGIRKDYEPVEPGNHEKKTFNNIVTVGVSNFLKTHNVLPNLEGSTFEKLMCSADGKITKEAFKKISFLYSTTLFRSSRDITALISEAIYPCPFRYNNNRIDNDFARMNDVANWLQELKQYSIFYDKSGGASWAYQDVRIGLNYLFEQIKTPTTDEEADRLESVKNRGGRARTHFWIAEWYVKSFQSTNHISQLIEAIYHWFSCIKNTKYARPRALKDSQPNLIGYRMHLIVTSLMQIVKVIKGSRTTLVFWMHGFQDWKLFEQKAITSALEIKNLTKEVDDSSQWFTGMLGNFKNINEAEELWREANFDKSGTEGYTISDYAKQAKRLVHLLLKESLKVETELNRQDGKYITVDRYGASNRSDSDAFDRLERLDLNVSSSDWWKWKGKTHDKPKVKTTIFTEALLYHILSIYPKSHSKESSHVKNFSLLVDYAAAYLKQGNQDILIKELNKLKQDWVLRTLGYSEGLLTLITIISEIAYLFIKQAKTKSRSERARYSSEEYFDRFNNDEEDGISRYWVIVCSLCWLGIDLLKNMPPNFIQEEVKLKCKFLSFYGLALAYLGRFFEGNRRINEGQSLLFNAVDRGSNEQAMLRLRRSELHLLQAITLKVFLKKFIHHYKTDRSDVVLTNQLFGPETFGALSATPKKSEAYPFAKYEEIIKQYELGLFDKNGNRLPEINIVAVIQKLYRRHISKLDDALTSCEATEYLMSGLNHSLLCWERLYTLKLRFFAELYIEEDDLNLGLQQEPLIFRRRIEYPGYLTELLDKGLIMCKDDPYGKLRFLDQYLKAIKKENRHLSAQNGSISKHYSADKLYEIFAQCKSPKYNEAGKSFYRHVKRRLKEYEE